jgi:hypothetical protein
MSTLITEARAAMSGVDDPTVDPATRHTSFSAKLSQVCRARATCRNFVEIILSFSAFSTLQRPDGKMIVVLG